jgi:hypothetical protein
MDIGKRSHNWTAVSEWLNPYPMFSMAVTNVSVIADSDKVSTALV